MGTVQAQHLSDAFSPNFRGRAPIRTSFQELQHGDHPQFEVQGTLESRTVFSDMQQSVMTGNTSGSRKRSRDYSSSLQRLQCPNLMSTVAMGQQYPLSHTSSPDIASSSSVVSLLAQDVLSHVYHHSVDTDALIRLQTDRLRLGLQEARKKHCRALLSVLGQQALKQLKEKEMELENASKRTAELEEKVRQMAAEIQMWFNVAKNNDAAVSTLRSTLVQVLLQSSDSAALNAEEEGYGDSDGISNFVDEERENKLVTVGLGSEVRPEDEEEMRRGCRVCGEREVCVLLLPCRHLCLCKDCEPKLDTCPVCHSAKNASLQIFLP